MENDQKILISGKPVHFPPPPPGWLEKNAFRLEMAIPADTRQEGGHRSLFIVHILEIIPFSECLNWLGGNILVDPWRADSTLSGGPVSCDCKKLNYSGCHDIISPATLPLHLHYRYQGGRQTWSEQTLSLSARQHYHQLIWSQSWTPAPPLPFTPSVATTWKILSHDSSDWDWWSWGQSQQHTSLLLPCKTPPEIIRNQCRSRLNRDNKHSRLPQLLHNVRTALLFTIRTSERIL